MSFLYLLRRTRVTGVATARLQFWMPGRQSSAASPAYHIKCDVRNIARYGKKLWLQLLRMMWYTERIDKKTSCYQIPPYEPKRHAKHPF
jgi:hypothetical protein